ncbi:MAG: ABC transporter ATP-binding protein [Balneolaceae bacterium]|nr:ABC transporter ATP-binding protein [Balneolaceae bacterium]MBO6544900.1 ABC transporter ATP-binding protein [Balneolaceae bacterium]MBO6646296.1 ABC transporter ATP-binding protein [Balneolaceae bacterium]
MISVQADRLSKTYNRRTVFSELSFSHKEGILGISGANGSGKSTLLKCLAGLLRLKSGNVIWKQGPEVLPKDHAKALIGYSAPYINLYDELSTSENLEFILEVSGKLKSETDIPSVLEYVQMKEYSNQLFKELSTGQQQRIKLAAALITKPLILFLDEPGSNLDEKGHELVERIVSDQKEKGTLLVLASNDPMEINLCDNVVVLS